MKFLAVLGLVAAGKLHKSFYSLRHLQNCICRILSLNAATCSRELLQQKILITINRLANFVCYESRIDICDEK